MDDLLLNQEARMEISSLQKLHAVLISFQKWLKNRSVQFMADTLFFGDYELRMMSVSCSNMPHLAAYSFPESLFQP